VKSHSGRSAILCSNDIYALDIIKEGRKRKLEPRRDYGIMGFDNIDVLQYMDVDLSTICYPIEDVAAKSVETMMALIEGEDSVRDQRFPALLNSGDTV
jgi:LacI family transcriptional regulator